MRVAISRPDLVTHLVLAVTSAGVDRQALGLPDWEPEVPPDIPSAAWIAARQPALDELIKHVDAPALLLWATEDEISPLALGRRLNELLRFSQLVTYASE
jgi:pimeloyl-ACP methyl ester carboxylesterase